MTRNAQTVDGSDIFVDQFLYLKLTNEIYLRKCRVIGVNKKLNNNGILVESKHFIAFDGSEVRDISMNIWAPLNSLFKDKEIAAKELLFFLKENRLVNKNEINIFNKSLEEGKFYE